MIDTQPISREDWYDLAQGFLDFGYRHAWDFNVHSAQRQGSRVEHMKVSDGGNVIGLASVRIKRIPLTRSGVAYIGGGPLTRRGEPGDQERLAQCIAALRDEYVHSRGLVLRISAPLTVPERRDPYESVYRAAGFVPATNVPSYRTLILDLSPSLEDVRAGLARRWRRDLNKSERSEFEVELGSEVELFDRFRTLFETFVSWKDFEVEHDARFHGAVQADLPDIARYLVVITRYQGEPAGGLVVAQTGDTGVYVLGASNPELRKLSPGHFLQWAVIEHLKQRGVRWYDLGGIDPDDNPGGYLFKSGMTKVEAAAPGPFEFAPGGLRGRLVTVAEGAYRRLGRLRRSP